MDTSTEQVPMRDGHLGCGDGKHHVDLWWHDTGRGVIIVLTGGESPHIGGVVVSTPRESLRGGAISCDSCVIPLTAHKDHIVGQQVAEAICCATNVPVSVSAGIHVDNATSDDLLEFQRNCAALASELIDQLVAGP